jgi:tetratricopeptide (TPR) repeat protein
MDRIARLQEFLKASPGDNFLEHALALEYSKAGNETEARKIFETILLRDPGYIGSYYHLAKLLERAGEKALALTWYEKGITAAKAAGDNHAYSELRAAYDDLTD